MLEYKFYVIGFVPADVVRLNGDIWFSRLDSEQVASVGNFLNELAINRLREN